MVDVVDGIEDVAGQDIPRIYKDAELRQKLIQNLYSFPTDEFFMNVCYHPELLIAGLEHAKLVTDLDDIPRMISRCIEYNLKESIEIMIDNEDKLVELYRRYERGQIDDPIWKNIWNMEQKRNPTRPIRVFDKRLYLRRIGSVECYLLARDKGYIDIDWEQAIIRIQRVFRRFKYNIPKTEDHIIPTVDKHGSIIPDHAHEKTTATTVSTTAATTASFQPPWEIYRQHNRYWGYRHTWHFLRWNRKLAYKVLREIIKGDFWGDCRCDAYLDFIEGSKNRTTTEPLLEDERYTV